MMKDSNGRGIAAASVKRRMSVGNLVRNSNRAESAGNTTTLDTDGVVSERSEEYIYMSRKVESFISTLIKIEDNFVAVRNDKIRIPTL